jgi:hypothetical protein
MNKLYDIIIREYNKYLEYNVFFEKEKLKLKEARVNLLKDQVKNPEQDITERAENLIFDVLIQEKIYSQDLQMLFYNLYVLVKSYQELEDVMVLPKELIQLCADYEHIVPKTVFVVVNSTAEEREKGTAEKIKTAWKDSGTLNILKTQLEQEINKQKDALN